MLKNLLNYLETENHFKYYLAVFRLYICFHILKKIFLQWESLSLIYDPNSFWVNTPGLFLPLHFLVQQNYMLFIGFIVMLLLLYFFGIGKYFVGILVFLLLKMMQDFSGALLNGGDNLLIFLVLYMSFADSYHIFSIKKLETKNENIKSIQNVLSNLAAYSILFHLCTVYFISCLHKIHSDVWFSGVANYYILHLDRFSGPFNHYFNNNPYIITISSYFTIFFEMYFPVLVWFKNLRNYFVVSGVLLHIGIYVFMMIYDFEILFMMTYGFLYSNQEWLNCYQRCQNKLIKYQYITNSIKSYVKTTFYK